MLLLTAVALIQTQAHVSIRITLAFIKMRIAERSLIARRKFVNVLAITQVSQNMRLGSPESLSRLLKVLGHPDPKVPIVSHLVTSSPSYPLVYLEVKSDEEHYKVVYNRVV